MTSFSNHSYQHAIRVPTSSEDGPPPSSSRPLRYNLRTLVASTFACVLVGSVAFLKSGSDQRENGAPSNENAWGLRFVDTGNYYWGSSHHSKKDHHGHHHDHEKHKQHHHHHASGKSDNHDEDDSKYQVYPGLRLEGYPSLAVQEQYMKDLKEIDWDAVEADLEELMTDSQDCKSPVLRSLFMDFIARYSLNGCIYNFSCIHACRLCHASCFYYYRVAGRLRNLWRALCTVILA